MQLEHLFGFSWLSQLRSCPKNNYSEPRSGILQVCYLQVVPTNVINLLSSIIPYLNTIRNSVNYVAIFSEKVNIEGPCMPSILLALPLTMTSC